MEYLDVTNIGQVLDKYKGGIVVIDNLENIPGDDKEKFFEFIKRSPRQIQYIVTSREEEPCEDKLHIKEFKDASDGLNFISKYIEENELDVQLTDRECCSLVSASKGNTLILVLSLLSLNDRSNTINGIISDLDNIRARDVEIIADFMYKNTFERSLNDLEKENYDPKKLITIMSLYREPIDLYSISKLAQVDIVAAEYICRYLASKLVLDKSAEFYSINEFANNFIFIKLLPNQLETNKLLIRIREHKERITEQRTRLEQQKARHSQIARIMQDWKPRNYVDERAIAEAFNLFQKIKNAAQQKNTSSAEKFIQELSDNELVTTHPYIKFQKARSYTQVLYLYPTAKQISVLDSISRSYEDTIQEIEFTYPYIKGSESHGAVLWFYGTFLQLRKQDYPRAIRYLEEARTVLSKTKSKNYFQALRRLADNYQIMYENTRDRAYKHRLSSTVNEIKNNLHQAKKVHFDVDIFLRRYNNQ